MTNGGNSLYKTHNQVVPGSSPGGPTQQTKGFQAINVWNPFSI